MKSISKKIFIVIILLLTLFSCLNSFEFNSYAADAATAHKYALSLLSKNEGGYTSVNKNDNGALSIGKLQWHAGRAKNLLKTIINKNPTQGSNLLGSSLYNEILSSKSWESRTVNDSEAAKIKKLLGTNESKAAQDKLESDNIMSYINAGIKLGLNDNAVLVYYADMYNQGPAFANDIAKIAKNNAGSYAKVSIDIIHNAALANQNQYFKEKYWNGIKNRRNNTYKFCKQIPSNVISYVEITQGNYYLKNSSTGTYLNISGGKAANGQAAVLSAKKDANSFKFYASGSKDKGYYLLSLIDKNYALNPYSDTPGDGSKITLYKKASDGTQQYFFEKSGNGYIIHNSYNQNCVLTPSGSNVLLKTKTGAANQVWILESADTTNVISYVEITQGNYYLKNSSNGTYLNISGGKAANGQAAVLSAKKDANSFKFYASGSKDKGYYLLSLIDKNYALNPYSDTPGDGSKITLYKKASDGTQQYFFEKSGNGYIIHNSYNQNCVLTPSGSNVLLKTKTGAANQVWILESADTTIVKFHRNTKSDDTTTVSEKFTVGIANQKFGYNTDGTGRYGTMNSADVGFGQWTNPGYKLLGWSKDKNAATSSWQTYSSVIDSWIKNNAPSVDLYAVWQKERPIGDINNDKEISILDLVILKKYLISSGSLDSFEYSDMNNDDKINVFDFIILKRKILNK